MAKTDQEIEDILEDLHEKIAFRPTHASRDGCITEATSAIAQLIKQARIDELTRITKVAVKHELAGAVKWYIADRLKELGESEVGKDG